MSALRDKVVIVTGGDPQMLHFLEKECRWWRQAMMGGANASTTASRRSRKLITDDLKAIDVPTLVMHGDDDQIVPIANSAPLSAKLLEKAMPKIYPQLPHGMCTTHADLINADLLNFLQH